MIRRPPRSPRRSSDLITAVNEGGISPSGSIMVLLPPVVSGLAAFPGNQQVTLNWSSQVGATNYVLEVSTTNGGPYTVLLNTTNNSYVNTGLTRSEERRVGAQSGPPWW